MQILIKRAIPNQAKTLTQIAFAAKRFWGYPERWIQLWAPILTLSPEYIESNEVHVAFVDGAPVGFYALSLNDDQASLDHLWVLPDFIGQGVGKALFGHALAQCEKNSVHILEIESDPNAQGFYEHMGAKKIGDAIGEVDGQPRILPVLEIPL